MVHGNAVQIFFQDKKTDSEVVCIKHYNNVKVIVIVKPLVKLLMIIIMCCCGHRIPFYFFLICPDSFGYSNFIGTSRLFLFYRLYFPLRFEFPHFKGAHISIQRLSCGILNSGFRFYANSVHIGSGAH